MSFLPELGIGLSFSSGLKKAIKENKEKINVLEIEPQTFWYETQNPNNPYFYDEDNLNELKNLNIPKIIHGIGFPVGGTIPPSLDQYKPLTKMISSLKSVWTSEHLGFNQVRTEKGVLKTGFLLPPRQTGEGVKIAVNSIKSMASRIPNQFCFETGVNYLQPRSDELPDGYFIRKVAEGADCGIILDLHNIWANELNGRQSVKEYIDQLPLERVWEIHVAGGFEYKNYWLDAHSGGMQEDLFDLCKKVMPRFPNLKAIIFEMFPSYIEVIGTDFITDELKKLHELWRINKNATKNQEQKKPLPKQGNHKEVKFTPKQWEESLASVILKQDVKGELPEQLKKDSAIEVIRSLIGEFRASMIVGTLKLSSRLMMLTMKGEFEVLLKKFWQTKTPELFATSEAKNFVQYLRDQKISMPYLENVLEFEQTALEVLETGKIKSVKFDYDPLVILRSLAERKLPENPTKGNYIIDVTPEKFESEVTIMYH